MCNTKFTHTNRGFFGKGEMQREFEEVAFALKPSEVSNVVDTASGVHLIQRYSRHLDRRFLSFHSWLARITDK